MKRHTDALAISEGACNPAGIARSLVEAIDEARRDGAPWSAADPAVKLILHQLCYLVGLPTDEAIADWETWREQCRAAVTVAA